MEQEFTDQLESEDKNEEMHTPGYESDAVENGSEEELMQNEQPISFQLAKAPSGLASKKREVALSDDIQNEADGWLTVDVYETPTDIVVESAVAGVNPDDLDITASADSITIKGERRRSERVRKEDYLYQECYWGRFSRSIILPQEVDPETASVSFQNGILVVRLPKAKRQKAKKLQVGAE